MDKQLISEKLESLRRCVLRLEEKCPESFEQLKSDIDAQDIVTLNLTRAVQLSVDIAAHLISDQSVAPPNTMAKSFDEMVKLGFLDDALATSLKKSVGFRNIAIHEYEEINWEIVSSICKKNVGEFKQYALLISKMIG